MSVIIVIIVLLFLNCWTLNHNFVLFVFSARRFYTATGWMSQRFPEQAVSGQSPDRILQKCFNGKLLNMITVNVITLLMG
jgi:hypothetical protein